jgi:3-hexulose-6-phosphate synthase
MKLQISFDMTNLDRALEIAGLVHEYADILEIGTLLIYANGIEAVKQFRETFPDKILLTDTKIVDRGKESIALFVKAETDWVTVMAGTNKNVIHASCSAAHERNKKVLLDMIDSKEIGQSALEAKNLGADALLVHQPYDEVEEPLEFLDKWEMVRGNTDLPIFISTRIGRDNIEAILNIKPDGIIVGHTITEAQDPREEAKFFYNICKGIEEKPAEEEAISVEISEDDEQG